MLDGSMAWDGTNILRPPPAQIALRNRTPNKRTKRRTTHNSQRISHNRRTSLLRRPNITQHTTRIRDWSRAKEPRKESSNQHGLDILCRGRAKGKYACEEIGRQDGCFAAVEFGEGGPEEGAEAEAEQ